MNQVLIRHGGVRFSPDGKSVVTWGGTSAEVVDADTGRPRYAPLRHEGRCFDIDFTPDGCLIATAGYDQTVRLWDAATGRPAMAPLAHAAPVYRVRAGPGNMLVTNCLDGAVHAWDWTTGRAVFDARTPRYAFVCSPSPDGRWLLAGCDEQSLHVLDSAGGGAAAPPVNVSGAPWSVEVAADGKYAAVAGSGASIDVIDLAALNEEPPAPPDAIRVAELTSYTRLEGGEPRPLSASEWLDRWNRRGRR